MALTGNDLQNINNHPDVNVDPIELQRIDRDFREYKNETEMIEFVNSMNNVRKRPKTKLNMRKLTSEIMASLVFNEQCEINVSEKSFKDANDFIRHVFEHNDFKKNLAKYLEPMFATGGLAVRPYVDPETGEVEFSWALANAFYPLKSTSNGITDGVLVFKSFVVKERSTTYYTLLEFNQWKNGNIEIRNELYKSDRENIIGKQVPLGTDGQYEGLEPHSVITEVSRSIFNYLKPAGFNNYSLHSPLGLGICDNSVGTLRQIDDTYDEFNWEIKMGQRTVAVSDHILDYVPDEKGETLKPIFDPDNNVFRPMRMDQDSELIKDLTNDIRAEQYITAINHFFKTLEMELQLSVGTFSFDGKSVKTATEIVSENSLTYRTRNMHCNEVEKFIKGVVVSTLELAKRYIWNGKALYTGEIPSFEDISVDFDDGIFSSQDQKLDFYSKAANAGLVSKIGAIKSVFNMTDDDAVTEWQRIIAESTQLDPMEVQNYLDTKEFGERE